MYYLAPYRFTRVIVMLFIVFAATINAQAQSDGDTVVPVIMDSVAAPDEEYDEESSDSDNYNRDEELPPELRAVSDSVVSKLQRNKDFEYANDPSYLVKEKEEPVKSRGFWEAFNRFFSGGFIRTLTWIAIIGVLIFAIYRIIVVNNLYFYNSGKKSRALDEPGEEELTPGDIDARINKAIADKDYRSAIRFQYLKSLNLLNDRGWIRLHAQATNHDYVFQLRDKPVAADFRFLTRVYDFVWYGEFAVNEEQFTKLQSDFQRFYHSVRS